MIRSFPFFSPLHFQCNVGKLKRGSSKEFQKEPLGRLSRVAYGLLFQLVWFDFGHSLRAFPFLIINLYHETSLESVLVMQIEVHRIIYPSL
jgi:hypothetical protein